MLHDSQGEYEIVANDYDKAKTLFADTKVNVFKRGLWFMPSLSASNNCCLFICCCCCCCFMIGSAGGGGEAADKVQRRPQKEAPQTALDTRGTEETYKVSYILMYTVVHKQKSIDTYT